jgi:thiol-disulfide isomerase/thioredoxin
MKFSMNYAVRSTCLLFLLSAYTSFAQNPLFAVRLEIGQKAPDIHIRNVGFFHAPPNTPTTLDAFRGQFVIMEFWATWCAPCLKAMKHLDSLAAQFEGQPVRFVAITDERQEVIEKFLQSRKSKLWIGLDSAGMTSRKYGVVEIPRIVIINPNGEIYAVVSAQQITEEHLYTLLSGKNVQFLPLPTAEEFIRNEMTHIENLPLPRIIFKPCEVRQRSPFSSVRSTDRESTLTDVTTLAALLLEAYQIQGYQLHLENNEEQKNILTRETYFGIGNK